MVMKKYIEPRFIKLCGGGKKKKRQFDSPTIGCAQVDPEKLRHALKTVLFNQMFISAPTVVAAYHLTRWRGDPCGPQLPTLHWALAELTIFSILEEVLFYYSHR